MLLLTPWSLAIWWFLKLLLLLHFLRGPLSNVFDSCYFFLLLSKLISTLKKLSLYISIHLSFYLLLSAKQFTLLPLIFSSIFFHPFPISLHLPLFFRSILYFFTCLFYSDLSYSFSLLQQNPYLIFFLLF